MSTHSVEGHLRVPVEEYDRAIRVFVPHYDEMLDAGIAFLKALTVPEARVLELGCGTGRFSQAILKGLPTARLTVLDIDPAVLAGARGRLSAEADRVRFLEASFLDPLPEADAVVAALSLHHIHDLSRKTEVYRRIRGALAPGGLFLCLDAAVSADPGISALTFQHWVEFMGRHGVSPAEARGHLKAWEREDRYFPLHEELAALTAAGFPAPECFWRRGPMAIYGGVAR